MVILTNLGLYIFLAHKLKKNCFNVLILICQFFDWLYSIRLNFSFFTQFIYSPLKIEKLSFEFQFFYKCLGIGPLNDIALGPIGCRLFSQLRVLYWQLERLILWVCVLLKHCSKEAVCSTVLAVGTCATVSMCATVSICATFSMCATEMLS